MHIKIATLAENTAARLDVLAEHGLSMFVEVDRLCLLLDTGQTDTVLHNAHVLGVDLSRVQHIVLSHGHMDHTGGLARVLAETGAVTVHAHTEVWRPRYSVRSGNPRFSGMSHLREQLESMGATFKLSDGPDRISREVMTTGPVPRLTPFEHVDADLKVKTPRGMEQDQVPDDQSLLIKTPKGLVVLAGCAHSGIVNTLTCARQVSGERRIYAMLGGTHLGFAPKGQLEQTVAALRDFQIERVGVSHCTGMAGAVALAREYGESFFFNNVGTVTEWEM